MIRAVEFQSGIGIFICALLFVDHGNQADCTRLSNALRLKLELYGLLTGTQAGSHVYGENGGEKNLVQSVCCWS
jgi:hypothetical protein